MWPPAVTFWLIIFVSRLSANAEAINPLKNPGICGIATECDTDLDDEKFHYQPHIVYKYLYESSFETLFDGTDNNDPPSELHISAFAELSFPSKCQGQLKISSTQLKYYNLTTSYSTTPSTADYEYDVDEVVENISQQPNGDSLPNILHERSLAFAKDVEQMTLFFEFRDGLIEEICPNSEEQVWVTNFKRGILSALQNTMARLDLDHKATEVDVSGKCDVKYEFTGAEGTSIVIKKTKDIASCQKRNKFKSIIQTTPYAFRKNGISWWPIYNSSSYCEMSIDNYIYNNIVCRERHVLIPFSNAENGAVTKSFMRLKLVEEINSTSSEDIYIEKRQTLLYDHTFSPKPVHNDVQLSRLHLIEMCSLGTPNIQREFPDQFVKFLSATRQLSLSGLKQLLGRAGGICKGNTKNGRKHVLESLPYIESAASIELMKTLLMDKSSKFEITSEIKEAWLMSMFYLPRPDQKVMESMFNLIQFYEQEQNPMLVLIPTSVVHTYCRNVGDCRHDYIVMNIVKYLEKIVIETLPKDLESRKTYEKLIVAMKGIGNIGLVSPQLRKNLEEIIVDESYSDDIKIQAIQLFRKSNCDETREFFMDIYRNFTQSVEVRIASYVQVMKCPTYLTIKDIKEFLREEKVNQVGSFVWSFLTNLAKTSSPLKVELQALLADNIMDDKFNLDFRKFSKNYENSLFFDEYNFGATGESNVIFGTESYIPRSISFNGTLNLFGGSVNAFEFNIRMQGLERFVESIFGPDGSFNFAKIMESLRSYFDIFKGYLENNVVFDFLHTLIRPRRNTDNLLEGFAYKPNYDFNKPNGYFEHKIYGNDINFYHFNDFNELHEIVKKLIPFEKVKNIFSSQREVFIDSGTLVDVSYTVPSSSGFPLIFSGFGAYSLDISYFASINNQNPWETKSLDFTGKLRPSLSMELNTAMQVDFFYDTTEIKFKSNIFSNHALETDIVVHNYTKASVKLKLPQDRNDIFSIRTQLLSKLEGKESLLYGINDKYNGTSCTWPALEETIGLKMCVDYNLPDVSNQVRNYPSLILSGPINFDIHLDKADLSAKIFTFDYNWNRGSAGSEGSIVFETPQTKIPRKLSAVLLTNPTDYNFTMKLINGDKVQTFLGKVKNSTLLKSLDFSMSQNDKTHLLLEIKLQTEVISKSRTKTTPSVFLTVRDQKIFGLMGVVTTTNKNDVKHHQFTVTCETKRLYSKAQGTLTTTDASLTLNTELYYKFPSKEPQTVDILLELANRGQKKTELLGTLKFESSSYPNLNFILNGTFVSSLNGHAELRFDFNNAADLMNPAHTLTTRISLARQLEDSKTSETTFFIDIKRPRDPIDFKFYVKYEERFKNGTEHNAIVLVRINPNQTAEAKTSIFLPKGNLFGVDGTFSIKLPDLGSCSAKVIIMERMRKDYSIDMSGEWFTNENISVKGTYEDRTSNVKRFYKLKTFIKSNMFDDVNLNLKYSRDLNELKLHVNSDYKSKSYSFILESLDPEPLVDIFKSEIIWAEYAYSLNANLSKKGIGRTRIEIHLDRIRDMHIEIWGMAKTFSKNAGIEFKWDANRDPSQKIIFSYDFNSPRAKVYAGNVLMSYPERTINGEVKIVNEGPYTGMMKISWSADEIIDGSYTVGSDFQDYKKLWAIFKVDTPFSGWRTNRINASIFTQNNLFEFTFDSRWAESQSVGINFFVDYLVSDKEISSDLRGSIQSTIENIPEVFSHFKYNQTANDLDSDVLFKYSNGSGFKTFSMKTLWKRSYDEMHRNISGSITFLSPIENYASGAMVTKFSTTKDRELFGVIDVDVDSRLYSFATEGYLRKFFDNMISFNISTPIETFPSLLGKFGINENKRYLIADLKTHNKSLGIEILFDFQTITDFDLKFYAATPQPAFERILAIGTIRDSVMHIEGAWNKINIGFKRVAHFTVFNDFEYSYQVFTPLAHFEQNGVIFKVVAKNVQNFDIETSLKLGKYKMGLQAFGEPKKQLINQLGLQKATYIREEINTIDDLESDEAPESANFDIDLDKFYSLVGHFEICTVIWTPITGTYDIQQIDETFHGEAKILIPKGAVSLSNKFILKSPTDFMNRLKIDTPIPDFKTITSNFKVKIPINDGFTTRFDVGIKGVKNYWKNYGFKLNYALPKVINSKIHDVNLIILYPIMNTSRINIKTRIELAKSGVNRANFSLNGFGTKLEMSGFTEKTLKTFHSVFNVELKSPVIPHYVFNSYVQKINSGSGNKIMAGFQVDDNHFDTELFYRQDPNHIIDGHFTVKSNIFPIQKFNSTVFISQSQQPEFDIQIRYADSKNQDEEVKFKIMKNGNKFEGEIVTPFKEISMVDFAGEIFDQNGAYQVRGKVFKDTTPYGFDGTVAFAENIPSQADLTIKNDIKVVYGLKHDGTTRKITATVSQNDKFMSFESVLVINNIVDWAYNVRILSSREELNDLKLSTALTPESKTRYVTSFEMRTPWKNYLIDKIDVSSDMNLNPNSGVAKMNYEISKYSGNAECGWRWIENKAKQDYMMKIATNAVDSGKNFKTEFSFLNPQKSPANIGFAIDINSIWKLSTKAKFDLIQAQTQDMFLIYDLSLPKPIESDHHIEAKFKGSKFPPKFEENSLSDCSFSYSSADFTTNLKLNGNIEQFPSMNNLLTLEWGNSTGINKIGSDFELKKVNEKSSCKWELLTPQNMNKKTLIIKANYDHQDVYKILHADINYPESNQVAIADIAFMDMHNTKGALNSSLPIFNVSWFHLDFNFDSMSEQEKTMKVITATWPDNFASIDSMSTYKNSSNHQAWTGAVKAEIPLQTRHNIQIVYGLEEKPLITTGHGSVEYNAKNVLNSTYTCRTEKINSGQMKDVVDLSIENELRSVGIHYTHEKKKRPAQKFDYNKKHLEVFDLTKENRFNITGEFVIEIKDADQNYKLIAIHPNRTIVWNSNYKALDTETHQSSKIELSQDVWLAYDFELLNTTKNDEEGQVLKLEVSYPMRKIVVGGNYSLKSDALDTDVIIKWNKREEQKSSDNSNEAEGEITEEEFKSINGVLQWKDLTNPANDNHQSILLALKHPKFEKDVTVLGTYFKDKATLSKIEIDIDYTEDEDHHAKFVTEIKNLSEDVGYKNYSFHVKGDHEASSLHLFFDGSVGMKPSLYKVEAVAGYKRSYLPDQELEMIGFFNSENRELKYYRQLPSQLDHVYGIYKPKFPVYMIEGIYVDSENNTAGNFILNLKEKSVIGDVNLTEDATQKFQMRGIIPDTRSALLNIWRDYEDKRIDDVSYFVQMNHSRLITSKFLWRPKIKKEVKENLKKFMASRYNALANELDYWVHIFYTETKDIIGDIWDDSKGYMEQFTEDLSALKDIDEDLLAFRNFLNESYHADDFYIQSLMNYTLTILDELAIADHIQTIPKFFKEMWVALGESSSAFSNSVLWIVNMVKASYKESLDTFNKLLHGNAMEYVTQFLNIIIENYDKFVKELHIKFINYVETMYDNLVLTLSSYWSKILQSIEPQIIRSIHYVETTLWSISSEIFDFMYNRTNEIIESPYFVRVSNITRDLDILYHDMKTNDMFTNFKKYSGLLYKFAKEKFLRLPFAAETRDVLVDLGQSLKDLRNVEGVKEYFDQIEEIQMRIKWLMNEFQLDKRLNALLEILKKKLARITQNALETEDVYREAKTKFIFDPDVGVIEWEQKLPISWHAFNETPQFEEVPEYRLFNDVQTFLFGTKNSSWNFYYGIFVNEPQNLVPPFKAQALLVGSRHVITFDKTNLEFDAGEFGDVKSLDDQCSYLLAHDFIDNQFTIVLKPFADTKFMSKILSIKSKKSIVEIELGNPLGLIKVSDQPMTILPTTSGDFLITRELNVVTVTSMLGFKIQCNLEFDVCHFELSGWYFGKIAGVLGTMNNENFDDLTTADNEITENKAKFIESWITKGIPQKSESLTIESEFNEGLFRNCDSFFMQKTSYFTNCFLIVDPLPFYEMCIQLGRLPKYQITSKTMEQASCTSAIAYIDACAGQNVPLRIPDTCIHCNLPNGSYITEGDFKEFKEGELQPSVDVVFLIESNKCNIESSRKKMLTTFVTSLTKELKTVSIDDVRFAVVAFGGSGEFEKPKTITSNGRVFTDVKSIQTYFDHVKSSNGASADVFSAVTKASELIFKPGAVKIFVLSLCSECQLNLIKFDFKSVSQLLNENDITLHLLTNGFFEKNRRAIGVDNKKAFSKSDRDKLIGDEMLRGKIGFGKSYKSCASLALETEGSIFVGGNKTNENELRTIATVFAKRVAVVQPKPCHICECEGHNSGTAYFTCFSCENYSRGGNDEDETDIDDDENDDYLEE